MDISHKGYIKILNEKDRYERIEENIKTKMKAINKKL